MDTIPISHGDLLRRAQAAYFRSAPINMIPDQPSKYASGVEEVKGRTYVVLANNYRMLAVYRLTNRQILKRLKRWPKDLDV
jgi:hypothetical protein